MDVNDLVTSRCTCSLSLQDLETARVGLEKAREELTRRESEGVKRSQEQADVLAAVEADIRGLRIKEEALPQEVRESGEATAARPRGPWKVDSDFHPSQPTSFTTSIRPRGKRNGWLVWSATP